MGLIAKPDSPVFLVVGLGNPGEAYQNTRHNIGYMVLDVLSQRFKGTFRKGKGPYLQARTRVNENSLYLIKPITFMNVSGQAVKQAVQFYKADDYSRLLILLDDINLPFGTIRLRPSGTDGGQKGLRSILQELQTEGVPRLRIGVGNPKSDASKHVLSPFSKSEQKFLPEVLNWAADAVESFITKGIAFTMSRFNRNILDH